MAEGYLHVELLGEWVTALLSGVDRLLDDPMKEQLPESCERACASHHGTIEMAQSIAESTAQIDERLEGGNQGIPWCGRRAREDDSINAVCDSCGCPLAREGLVTLPPGVP